METGEPATLEITYPKGRSRVSAAISLDGCPTGVIHPGTTLTLQVNSGDHWLLSRRLNGPRAIGRYILLAPKSITKITLELDGSVQPNNWATDKLNSPRAALGFLEAEKSSIETELQTPFSAGYSSLAAVLALFTIGFAGTIFVFLSTASLGLTTTVAIGFGLLTLMFAGGTASTAENNTVALRTQLRVLNLAIAYLQAVIAADTVQTPPDRVGTLARTSEI